MDKAGADAPDGVRALVDPKTLNVSVPLHAAGAH